jgi:DNA repair protein RecO (recombination protein O)
VVSVLSPEHGVLALLARGAYRPTSRYFAVLDLFCDLELEWRPRRSSDLGLLVAGARGRSRSRLTSDLEAYRAALAGLEAARLAARPGRPEPELFALTAGLLDALDRRPWLADVELAAFDLGYLGALGLEPALAHCASCGRPAPRPGTPQRSAFSAARGGRLCRPCALAAKAEGARVGLIPTPVLTAAEVLRASGPGGLAGPTLEAVCAERRGVTEFVERFLEYHLERRPRGRRRLPRPRAAAELSRSQG